MTVLIKTSRGSSKVDRRRLRKITEDLLDYLRLQDRDLSILFTDNKGIARFNNRCFGKDSPTNVISFSYLDGFQNEVLGDLIISTERAKEEAESAGIPFYDRLLSLVVHGLVHILGFDHVKEAAEARRMRYRERKLLRHMKELDVYKEIGL
jgi:rRNA maturation RNase YbeY